MQYSRRLAAVLSAALSVFSLAGCGSTRPAAGEEGPEMQAAQTAAPTRFLSPEETIAELEEGLSMVAFRGQDGFGAFLEQGGAADDREVVQFLVDRMGDDLLGLLLDGTPFGCSTLTAVGEQGEVFFGRNFDWNTCDALIVESVPESGYASL